MRPSLIVHGGAGLFQGDRVEDALGGCEAALRAGCAVLDGGGSALDAVEAAVRLMEDLPVFNAGTGSALNADGEVEMDACVMTGALEAGAVAAVRRVRNPVSLARLVLERSRHVLLVADGAERFAREHGVPLCEPAELVLPAQVERLRAALAEAKLGTVGAVARDARGGLAAATSTGGIVGKAPGRVGDSPIVGAGTYADDELGVASATGQGEAIIKACLCRHAVELLGRGLPPREAALRAVERLSRRTGGQAGLIVISRSGETGCAFNTPGMSRAWRGADGEVRSEIEPPPPG